MTVMKQNQNDTDARILAAIQKRNAGPEQHEIKRADGTEKLVSQPTPPGTIESSVHMSTWKEVDAKPKVIEPATQTVMQDEVAPVASQFVSLGDRVLLAPSGLSGWTKVLTRDASAFLVLVDGVEVHGDDAIAAIYEALLDQQKKGRK